MSILTTSDRLRYLRNFTKLNRTEFAEKHNIPERTLRAWESGKVPLTSKGATRCIELYKEEGINVREEWLMHGIGSPPITVETTKVTINQNELFTHNNIEDLKLEANLFKQVTPTLYIYFIENEEMLPIYNPGDFVGGVLHYQDFYKFNGKDCIVILESEKIYFRTLTLTSNNKYNLLCKNPFISSNLHIFDAKIKAIAPIKFHRIK